MRVVNAKSATIVFSILLGVVFAVAGLGKLFQPAQLLANVYSYGVLSKDFGYLVAVFLPWLEIVIGIALLSGRLLRGAFLTAGALLVIFVLAQIAVAASGRTAPCGCALLPDVDEAIGVWTIMRTCVLAAFAALGYVAATLGKPRAAEPHVGAQIIHAAVVAGFLVLPAQGLAWTRDNNGGVLISEAAEHLNEIYGEHFPLISSYMHGTAIAPDPELRKIQAVAVRWLDQMGRGLRADTIEFSMPEGGFLRSAALPISHLLTASDMQMFQASLSTRASDYARAGSALLTTSTLMEYLRDFGSISAARGSQSLGKMLSDFAADAGHLSRIPRPTLALLQSTFESLPTDDPFGHLTAFRQNGQEWLQWAAASRDTAAGSEFLDLVARNMHPSLLGMNELTGEEFAIAAFQADQFFKEVAAAVEIASPEDSVAALTRLQERAQSGECGPFAAIMTDPDYYNDLTDMRLKIDESKELVDGLVESLNVAIEDGPMPNAAEFYLAAAALMEEADAAGMVLRDDEGKKFAEDILVLFRAGSECEWCDFSAAKDITSFVIPEYAPALLTCIDLLQEETGESDVNSALGRAIVLVRVAKHLAGDTTFASSDLSFRAFNSALAILREVDVAVVDGRIRIEIISRELNELTESDLFGWNGAVDALRLAWRSRWADRVNVAPENVWKTYGAFVLAADAEVAWIGLFGLLSEDEQKMLMERIAAYEVEGIDPANLLAAGQHVPVLIEQNDQQALAELNSLEFEQLFPSLQLLEEAQSEARGIVHRLTSR